MPLPQTHLTVYVHSNQLNELHVPAHMRLRTCGCTSSRACSRRFSWTLRATTTCFLSCSLGRAAPVLSNALPYSCHLPPAHLDESVENACGTPARTLLALVLMAPPHRRLARSGRQAAAALSLVSAAQERMRKCAPHMLRGSDETCRFSPFSKLSGKFSLAL